MKISLKKILLSSLFFKNLNSSNAAFQEIINGSNLIDALKAEFIQWNTKNMTIVTGDKNSDINFLNTFRILTKENIFTKGNILDDKAFKFILTAEEAHFSCDRKNRKPIHLPAYIFKIKTLRSLFLKNIAIPETISRITELSNLETLELHSCNIYNLTCMLPNGSKLKKLIIHDSNIKYCYLDEKKVPNLEEIVINNTNLNSLNREFFTLSKLKKINLSGNHLFEIGKFLPTDTFSFQELNLSKNKFKVFPSEFNLFKSMKKFNISNNFIENFENGFKFHKNSVEELNLQSNLIMTIPEGIINLEKLKVFDATSNQLENIDTDIFRLPKIEKILLKCNKFKNLGDSFNFMTRLLMRSAIPADAPLSLKELDLSYNFLSSLPTSTILFKNLKKLNLRGNLFETIPIEIVKLKNLETLDMATNRLQYVSPNISELPLLYELDLTGGNDFRSPTGDTNVIKRIPMEIFKRGSKKLIRIKLKGNPLEASSTMIEYGRLDLTKYYGSWVSL